MKEAGQVKPHKYHFTQKAFEEGAHLNKPKNLTEESWNKKIDILALHVFGEIPLTKLAKDYGYQSTATISDHEIRGIFYLQQELSEELKTEFPIESITKSKIAHPRRPVRQSLEARRRRSLKKGGASAFIAREIDAGKPLQLIEDELRTAKPGFTELQLEDAKRRTLKKWGYDLYETTAERYNRLNAIFADPNSSDHKIRNALQEVNNTYYSRSENLVAITRFLQSGGYHVVRDEVRPFIYLFQRSGVPVGRVLISAKDETATNFIWRYHQEAAEEILRNTEWTESYKKSPFSKVSGGKVEIPPTTNDFRKNPMYKRVGKLLENSGLPFPSRRYPVSDYFMTDLGVPVWEYQGGYYYRDEDEERLRVLLIRRYEELKRGINI